MGAMSARGDAAQARLLPAFGRFVASGFDRRSPIAFLVLVTTGASVGYHWRDLLDANGEMDWLLAGIWAWMAALICWGVSLRRDLILVAVGACGGGVIEWWGTNTGLWSYFTQERPPLWILPAWPIAALSVDRMGQVVDWGVRQLFGWVRREPSLHLFRRAYFVLTSGFVLWMSAFIWPYAHLFASRVVIVVMIAVTLRCPDPRRDVQVFLAGSLLGVFLEYWGTSRECWTYYTQQVPPPVAVVAHGFAAIAFNRAAAGVSRALDWIASRAGAVREPTA